MSYFGYDSSEQAILDAVLSEQGSNNLTNGEVIDKLAQVIRYFTDEISFGEEV